MTTTRALAVAAYLAATATPAAADWRAIADQLHAALPAVRGAKADWFADWTLGKVYSLDSLDVIFADGIAVRVNLAKAPNKLPRIAASCRVAVAFYRARTGLDVVPAFASLTAVSDGATFDAEACSARTADLRRTGRVALAPRPAVTVEAVERAERELARRAAGLRYLLNGNAGDVEGGLESWFLAVRGAERELSAMRAALGPAEAAPAPVELNPASPSPVSAEQASPAPAPVQAIAEAIGHIEPMALCPAVGMPCKLDCGFRSGCGAASPVVEMVAACEVAQIGKLTRNACLEGGAAACATGSESGADLTTDMGPVATLRSDDEAAAVFTKTAPDYARGDAPGPVTVLCLSHKAREAVLRRTDGRAVPDHGHVAKGGAFRLSLDDARACADLRSVRFVGLPRKPYTRAAAPAPTPVVGMHRRTPPAAILGRVAPLSWVHPLVAGRARPPVVLHAAPTL